MPSVNWKTGYKWAAGFFLIALLIAAGSWYRKARALVLFDFSIAATPVTFTNGLPGEEFVFSWDAPVDVASDTAKNTYLIYYASGSLNPVTNGVLLGTVFDATDIGITLEAHTWSFAFQASNTVSGVFAQSPFTVHYFLASAGCAGNGAAARSDSAGTQIGMGQQWNFGYSLMADSNLTARIYHPSTTFSLNSMGFPEPDGFPDPVKVLVNDVPRSGALGDCSVENDEIWDTRDSSGSLVGNGIYFIYFQASNPLLGGTTLFAGVQTVPVDTLRFTKLITDGIQEGESLATVDYTITGDATVRILIAKPGRQLVLDSSGVVQSLDATGTAIDTTTNSVVQILTFNRQAGSYQESWNGTDQNSVSVSSGLYVVGLSALDSYGNVAGNFQGNDGPLLGSIPIDRTASQTATDTVAPSVSTVTASGTTISLSGGTTLSGSVSSVVVGLDETAGTGSNAPSITLTDPLGAAVAGTVSISGTDVTFTPATALSSTGTYTLSIIPRDTVGNTGSTQSTTFVIQSASSSGGGSSATDAASFRNSVYAYPNPARSAPVNIAFTLGAAGNLEFDVFNVIGERVYHQVFNGLSAGAQTITWNMVNDAASKIGSGVYVFRLRSVGGTNKVEAVKKLMIIQ